MSNRPASTLLSAAVLCAAFALPGHAQTTPTDFAGPTYSVDAILNKPVAGVRLDMTPEEARATLEASGFKLRFDHLGEAKVFFNERGDSFGLHSGVFGGRPAITYFYYTRKISLDELTDVDRWRSELISMFGEPTGWMKWINRRVEKDALSDRFYYAPEASLDWREEGRSCIFDWGCPALQENKDCRPPVRALRGATIEGSFGYQDLHVTGQNDELMAAEKFQDRDFRERDMSKAFCVIRSVH